MSMPSKVMFGSLALVPHSHGVEHAEDEEAELISLPYLDARPRSVDRIALGPRSGYRARVDWRGYHLDAEVINYSSIGMNLALPISSAALVGPGSPVDKLAVYLCDKLIAEIDCPLILHFDESTATLSLNFESSPTPAGARLATRNDFAPVVQVGHPMRCSRTIHFMVREFDGKGMLLECSLLNKTLLPGMVIRQATLVLPGCRTLVLDLKLEQVWFAQCKDRLYFDASFIDPPSELGAVLSQFSLHGVNWSERPVQDIPRALSAAGLPTKKIGPGLEVDVITSMEEYRNVLKVRLAAYQGASKVAEDTRYQDMGDALDQRSIILCARFSGHVVGTVRLVRCESEEQTFPFEQFFPNPLQGRVPKELLFEVSRLSILPAYQKTAIVFELFRQVADIAYRAKTPYVFLMSTRMLEGIYAELGTVKVGSPVPHPTLASEVLSLHLLDCNKFWDGENLSEQVRQCVAAPVLSSYLDPRLKVL